jgi:predicted RNA-binding Zn-ribbon protein involved in translation (DUF1610 family)
MLRQAGALQNSQNGDNRMDATQPFFRLTCPRCGWQSLCDPAEMFARLKTLGMLKRAGEPEWEIVVELFAAAAGRMQCSSCGRTGLMAVPVSETDSDWAEARRCEVCGQPIPRERLLVFPNARRCVGCQALDQSATSTLDYCPRCGAVMTLRQSRATGITKYELVCPACG